MFCMGKFNIFLQIRLNVPISGAHQCHVTGGAHHVVKKGMEGAARRRRMDAAFEKCRHFDFLSSKVTALSFDKT